MRITSGFGGGEFTKTLRKGELGNPGIDGFHEPGSKGEKGAPARDGVGIKGSQEL